MTSFPTSIKSYSTIVDLVDSILAAHQNERGDEITALETYLRGDTNATVTTANVTAAQNKIYNLTIAGLTANRNFTVPVATAAGQYLTMNIIDGDDTYYMILIGATTVTINGNAAATEWGRFGVKGDSITMRSTSTTNWQIVAFNSNSITDGQVLTATGAGLAPAWEAAASASTRVIEGCRLIWNSGSSLSVGTGVCYAENGDKIDITSTLTASSLTPTASTWYHIYVYLSGGSPAMEVVTTAPVAWKGTAYSKTGATTRRYIGSARSDAGGTPAFYNFEHNVGTNKIQYRLISQAATPFRCLSGGTATATTSVSLAAVVPVTATFAYIRPVNTSDGAGYYGTATLTTTAFQITINPGNTATQSNYVDITMDASQVIYYFLSGRTTGVGHIDVAGYMFNR